MYDATTIDLSNAQNEVVHPELLRIFKCTIKNLFIVDVIVTAKLYAKQKSWPIQVDDYITYCARR